MINYVGILDGAKDVWGVRIPDIAGCVGAGSTPDAAIANAVIALRDVATHKRSGGFELPCSRTLAQVMSSGGIGPGETTFMPPLLLAAGRTLRASLTFDAGLLEASMPLPGRVRPLWRAQRATRFWRWREAAKETWIPTTIS